MRRVLSFFVVLALSSAVRAQIRPELLAGSSEFDAATDLMVFTGHPVVVLGGTRLVADKMSWNRKTNVLTAEGHVELASGTRRLLADKITYDIGQASYTADRVRLGEYPLYVSGRSAAGTQKSIAVTNATVVLREPGIFSPTIKASKIVYSEGHVIEAESANAGVGPALPITLPKFSQKIDEPLLSYVSLTAGYRGLLGAFVDAGLHIPVTPGLQLGGDLGVYTSRGIMFGPSGAYTSPSDPDTLKGTFRSGYINDHGNKKNDLLDRPIAEDRSYVEWTHQQTFNEHLTLTAQLNYWQDSYIVRDFRPNNYFNVQQPDTFVEAVFEQPNYFVSFFTRLQPNRYYSVQERLPEIRFDLLPTALGQGFYEQFNASAAVLREDPPAAGTHLRSDRLDAYYAISRPVVINDWSIFTPIAGGRVTQYINTRGAVHDGDYTRGLGEVGFDSEMRTSATFNYQNPRWKIDGLRHLMTPKISYRYIPEADRGEGHIPQIDRDVFYSSYLSPLGLGDQRNIDDLHSRNTLRVGLDNTLQTRDGKYGSRDLVRLNIATDFRFEREPGERDLSEIHTELAVMPARWLQLDLYESFAPQSFTLRELNTGLTIHDADAWRIRVGNNYLHQLLPAERQFTPAQILATAADRDSNEYSFDGAYRLTESYELMTRLHYDARNRRFVEQSYGVRQTLANQWNIEYAVTLYDGPRRESKFGFRVQVDLLKF